MDLNTENPAVYFEKKAKSVGISINALCSAAGIARSTLTRWKSNANGANFANIQKLESALNDFSKKLEKPKRPNKTEGEIRQ